MKKKTKWIIGALLFSVVMGSCIYLVMAKINEFKLFNAPWLERDFIETRAEFDGDDFWQMGTPEEAGWDRTAVAAHLELARRTGADALLVARGNQVICEWYSEDYRTPMGAMSSTKSVTSLLAGIMKDRGSLNLNAPVSRYLPPWTGGFRDAVTPLHLLTMTSGLLRQTDAENSVGYVSDKNAFVLGLFPEVTPGERWSYSNEGVQLLSPLLEAAAGMGLAEWADKELFMPLGLRYTRLHSSIDHEDVWTYADMQTCPRDLGRIAWLVLNDGIWNGTRLISSEYLAEMTSPVPQNDQYGYLWWLYQDGPLQGYGMEGYLDTSVYIFPEEEMIIVRMQQPDDGFSGNAESGNYQSLAWKVIPAFFDPDSRKKLADTVSRFPQSSSREIAEESSLTTVNSRQSEDSGAAELVFIEDLDREYDELLAAVLEEGILLSREGLDSELQPLLIPWLAKPTGSLSQRWILKLTLILSFERQQMNREAQRVFRSIDPVAEEYLQGFWLTSYRSFIEQYRRNDSDGN